MPAPQTTSFTAVPVLDFNFSISLVLSKRMKSDRWKSINVEQVLTTRPGDDPSLGVGARQFAAALRGWQKKKKKWSYHEPVPGNQSVDNGCATTAVRAWSRRSPLAKKKKKKENQKFEAPGNVSGRPLLSYQVVEHSRKGSM